jgi:hypothetical protein
MTRPTLAALMLVAALAASLAGCEAAPEPASRATLADMNDTMVANAATMPMPMPDGSTADMAKFALYPGSKLVEAATIMPHEVDDMTSFSFWSPAPPAKLRDWYAGQLATAGYKLRAEGSSLVGTDDRGKPFRLDLTAAPGGNAMGVVSKS